MSSRQDAISGRPEDDECKQISHLLTAYFDGETTDLETEIAKAHIERCLRCAELWQSWKQTRYLLQTTPAPAVPPGLLLRILLFCRLASRGLGHPAVKQEASSQQIANQLGLHSFTPNVVAETKDPATTAYPPAPDFLLQSILEQTTRVSRSETVFETKRDYEEAYEETVAEISKFSAHAVFPADDFLLTSQQHFALAPIDSVVAPAARYEDSSAAVLTGASRRRWPSVQALTQRATTYAVPAMLVVLLMHSGSSPFLRPEARVVESEISLSSSLKSSKSGILSQAKKVTRLSATSHIPPRERAVSPAPSEREVVERAAAPVRSIRTAVTAPVERSEPSSAASDDFEERHLSRPNPRRDVDRTEPVQIDRRVARDDARVTEVADSARARPAAQPAAARTNSAVRVEQTGFRLVAATASAMRTVLLPQVGGPQGGGTRQPTSSTAQTAQRRTQGPARTSRPRVTAALLTTPVSFQPTAVRSAAVSTRRSSSRADEGEETGLSDMLEPSPFGGDGYDAVSRFRDAVAASYDTQGDES